MDSPITTINNLEQNANKLLLAMQDMAALGLSMKSKLSNAADNYVGFFEEFSESESLEEMQDVVGTYKNYYSDLMDIFTKQKAEASKMGSIFSSVKTKMDSILGEAKAAQQETLKKKNDQISAQIGKITALNKKITDHNDKLA